MKKQSTNTFERQINFSNNVLTFSMPEDFSTDMPAEALREYVDINSNSLFEAADNVSLLQRWWDIKKPGFFGKKLGTVMLHMSVHSVPENQEQLIHKNAYDPSDRLDFILLMHEILRSRYKQEATSEGGFRENEQSYNFSDFMMIGQELRSGFRDSIFNQKKWTTYSVAGPRDLLIVGSMIPVSEKVLLEVEFTYAPNNNVNPREFLEYAYKKTDIIQNSLNLTYSEQNSMSVVTGERWLKASVSDVIASKKGTLIPALFGPEVKRELDREMKQLDKNN